MRQGMRRIMIMAAAWLTIPLCAVATAITPPIDAAPVPDIAGGFQPLLRPFLSQLPEGLYSTAPYTLSSLNRINYHRAWAGAAPIALQSQISAAAQAHAVYLNLHQNASHEESSTLSGFTGQWAWDRMAYQGYNYSAAGEVISFGKDAQGGIDALITAIYHRFALLDPGYTETGIGDAPHAVYQLCQVINLGRPAGVAAATQAVSIYPADGQTEVPTSFDSNSESPDPMPTLGVVGYPVSIQFSTEQSVTLGTFTLAKEGQISVTTTLLSPTTDSNIQQSGKKNFSLIPNAPLQSDTVYQATFTATVQGKAYTASWSFTTVPPATLAVTPNPATFAMGQVGELTISDGSGGYQLSWSPAGKFTVAWSGDGNAMLITPVATGTATITLTDTSTQAKVQIPVTIINGPAALTGNRALATGWNLLALPLTPANSSVNAVLGGILNQVVSAWKWTGSTWAVLIPANDDDGAQYAADKGYTLLQAINAGEGFWINAAAPVTLAYSGSAPADATIPLSQGWNLVGMKSTKAAPVGDLAYPAGSTVISLWAWTGTTWAVTLPQESDGGADYAASKGFYLLQTINPGEGFWVNVQ